MGGYKGMLLAADKFAGDVKIHTRKSMRKFELDSSQKELDLEIVRPATYMTGYLNKQVILVLWANGVEISTFLALQFEYVKNLISYYHLEQFGSIYAYPEEIFQ
mmetsp:Transcript_1810/g.1598  ORF Transcript_1810/g.1598 Transcript_1810/m.1598 type:complete len:104 (-) Transcript_1810:66-377(-)